MKVLWGLAVLVGFVALTGLLVSVPIGTNDLWLHLATGERILEEARVPRVDSYTFTRAGGPYVAHEWLVQALFALVYRHAGGLTALSLLYAALVGAILAASHGSVARRLRSETALQPRGAARDAALLTTAAVFGLMSTALAIRPHLFTFLMAALYTAVLPSVTSDQRQRVPAWCALVALQIVWANLHGAFVIGILLAGIDAISRVRLPFAARSMLSALALPAALAAASCLNAYGPHLYALVLKFSDPVFRQAIVEWQSPFTSRFAATPLFVCYLAWLATAVAAAAWLALRRRELAPALLVLVFGAMSILSQRHIGLLAIVTAPAVGCALAHALEALARRRPLAPLLAARGSTVLLLVLTAVPPIRALSTSGVPSGPGRVAPNIPLEAVEVMRGEKLHGRVFTTIGFGSYVTWRGWPDLTTSIDSRLEVFGGAFLLEHVAAQRDAGRFAAFAARQPFEFALLPWPSPAVRGALAVLDADPAWALVYFDDIAALYARRTPGTSDLIERRGYRYLRPTGIQPGASRSDLLRELRRAADEPPVLPHRPPVNRKASAMLRALEG